jgi:predicted deacylase
MVGYRDVAAAAREPSEEAARRFGGGMLWQISDQRGTLTAELVRRGIACIGTEAPGEGRCSAEDVERNVQGLERLLRWTGMAPGGPDVPRLDGPAHVSVELTAPASGLLEPTVRLGSAVAAGGVVAHVRSPVGEPLADIRAPHTGRIGALRTFGSVPTGEIVAWLCRPAQPLSTSDPATTR